MRMVYVALIGIGCFLVGMIGPGLVSWATYPGANVRCIEGGRVCVGMSANRVLGSFAVEEPLGGMIDLTCGFTQPGQGALNHIGVSGLLRRECNETKMVASFTKGGDLTNLWIDNDRIVRIDRYANWPSGWP